MAEAGRELADLKNEVIEARNQAIKTDHQVKNVALDIKGFEKRFATLERRTRIASIGAHAIVALVITVAAVVVASIRARGYQKEIDTLLAEVERTHAQASAKETALANKLRTFEEAKQRRAGTQQAVIHIIQHLDAKRDREAAELLPKVHREELSTLELKLVEKRLQDLRKRAAESAYRVGKSFLNGGRYDNAVRELARSLRIEPHGTFSEKARYLQATTLYHLKRYDQAEPLLRELRKGSSDKGLLDEVRFLMGTVLARLGKREEAKAILEEASVTGQYQKPARSYLAALESGSPFPGDKKAKKSGNNSQGSAVSPR